MGDVTNKTDVALVLSQGSGAGGIFTFNAPYCQVDPFEAPDTANDIAIVDLTLRTTGSGTTPAFNISLT
jgi:hypothetical protein